MSTLIQIASSGSSSGRFGIADSNGVYTYYSTLQAAITAASAGQTVEFFTDYTETGNVSVNLKNDVNLNLNGHTYTLTNSGTANCIQDNGVGVNCIIANGIFKRIQGTPSLTNTLCLYITGASDITCYDVKFIQDLGSGNKVSINVNNVNARLTGAYCIGGNPTLRIDAGTVLDSNAIALNGSAISNYGVIKNCFGRGIGAGGIGNLGTAYNCVGIDDSTVGFGNGGTAINCSGKGFQGYISYTNSVNVNCTGTSSASTGYLANGAGYNFKCFGYSTAGYGIAMINSTLDTCVGFSSALAGIATSDSGANTSDVKNSQAISTASIGFYANNATTGCKIYNCTIESMWNNAAGHGIQGTANGLEIVNCTISVANASANALFASIARTFKYTQNSFRGATTSVNANITQGMINTDDAYGNITV